MRLWRGHGQFLAYYSAIFIHDHHQFAIAMAEGQAVPALVFAAPPFDAPPNGAALHLPEKIFDGEFHRACRHRRIYFGHSVGPTNHGQSKASAICVRLADSNAEAGLL